MTFRLRLFHLFLLLSAAVNVVGAQNCPTGGTTIFYGNGVMTTLPRAQATLWTLIPAIDHALDQKAPSRDPSCVKYDLAYDSLFVNGGIIFAPVNFIGQLITAALQLGLTNTVAGAQVTLYQSSETVPSLPDSWNALGNRYVTVNSLVSTFQPNVQNHRTRYQNELTNGNNVIVVAHSQGNLYVNQAFGVLTIPANRDFSTVAVASPANNALTNQAPPVCESGILPCHVTLFNDVISLVPLSLSENIMNSNNPDRCAPFPNLASMTRCHDVNKSYLLGNVTGPAMINAIVDRVLSKLTIVESGVGSGTVESTPEGINCGLNCEVHFYTGSTVSLSATPDPGSEFVTWSGDCSGTSETVTVNLTAAKTCTATYKLKTVTVTKAGMGTGTVSSVPVGISCAPTCPSQSAPFNGSVQLTATRAPGSIFNGWGGDCASAGTNTIAQVTTVSASKSCTATFTPGGHLTINKAGSGTGTVTSVPTGISCGTSCTAFPSSPPVQLTAAAASGSTFSGWTGDCSGTALTTTVTMTADKACTATFQSSTPAVRLNPFGMKNLSEGPFTIEVVNSSLNPVPAPRNITVNLLRQVVSPCRGVIFSSPRTFVISQGQASSGGPDAAGRDPVCNTSPTRTEWTITDATIDPGTPLDLTVVPSPQLFLSISR